MTHILLFDVPGGNDFTVMDDAIELGHEVTFCTNDRDHYRRQGAATEAALSRCREILETPAHASAVLEQQLIERHTQQPFSALLCLIDIRIIEASRIARRLGLPFLNPTTAEQLRDKFTVREKLAEHGLRQPRFALAQSLQDLPHDMETVGFPALIKPSDGYGSQNVTVLFREDQLATYMERFAQILQTPTPYGLGVSSNNRFLVEEYLRGSMIGCDLFCDSRRRLFLGINDKLLFPPPSFSFRGSCFPSNRFDEKAIQDYAFQILDVMEFDFGATHIEMMVTEEGPHLVEINPRLVSAQIPYLMGYAFGRSLYTDLIQLHLGVPVENWPPFERQWYSAIRWIVADRPGELTSI